MAAHRSRGDGLVGMATAGVVVLAALGGLLRGVDDTLAEWGMRLSPEREPGEDVVLVQVSESTLSRLDGWQGLADGLTRLLAEIRAMEPAVAAVVFPDTWRALTLDAWRQAEGPTTGADGPPLLLGLPLATVTDATEPVRQPRWHPQYLRSSRLDLAAPSDTLQADLRRRLGFARPMPRGRFDTLLPAPAGRLSGMGFLPAGTGIQGSRSPAAVAEAEGMRFPSLALHLTARLLGEGPDAIRADASGLRVGTRRIPTDAGHHFRPFFYAARDGQTVERIDADAILDGRVAAGRLRNRAVVVGTDSARWQGLQPAPGGRAMSAAEVVAMHTAALVQGHLYERPDWGVSLAWGAFGLVLLYLGLLLPRLGTTMGVVSTLLLAGLLFNLQLGLPALRLAYLDLALPLVALLAGHAALGARRALARRTRHLRQALSESNRELGEALKRQGQPHVAFERFLQCQTTPRLLENLYDLALDLERRRHFAKAQAVLHHLAHREPGFRDVSDRIVRLADLERKTALGGGGKSGPETLVLPDNGLENPTLGRYEIDRELGRGAMGAVYLGRDPRIGRTVAIKTMALAEEFEGQDLERVTDRFYQEAETAGRLNHPNIVTIYDVGEEADLAYIAMDYLDGQGLQHHTEPDRLLPATTICDIAIQVAEALDYAHGRGVVHRDIKPANMIYDAEADRVVLTDFGVACLTDSSRTKTGTILGTPSYMSPEQVLGRRVDGRSDLFSLGVTVYQLLRGELPFTGEPLATLLYKIANNKAPGVTRQRPDLPPCVGRIVKRALEKEPAERFQTGEEMAGALRRCRKEIEARLPASQSPAAPDGQS